MVMKYESVYPLLCLQGPVSGNWYIIADGIWHEVKRKYHWQELEKLWTKIELRPKLKQEVKTNKQEWKVEGSKGNSYRVVNDLGFWSCSCPAHGFSRGRDCKHIKQIKINNHQTKHTPW